MKKIVSNLLIVSTQLIVGGLFLFMLFSNQTEDNRVVVVENNNLDKMADAVSELFVVDHAVVSSVDESKEEELPSSEEKGTEDSPEQSNVENQSSSEEQVPVSNVETPVVVPVEPPVQNTVTVDATGYISNPAVGFNVTTGNATYALDDNQFAILATVVNCEANRSSRDDILAVMSVILNRADRYGTDPVSVVAAPYQFSCYTGAGTVVSENVASVMRDALGGIRNNNYTGFNSWYNTGYSSNYIVEGGNRYR